MSNQNEMLELIFAVKSLAQNVQNMHQDIRRLIEEKSRDSHLGTDKLHSTALELNKQLSILPILVGEKVEKTCKECATETRLERERRITGAVPMEVNPEREITGKIEVNRGGQVKVLFNSAAAARFFTIVKWVVVTAAAGGGLAELIKWVKNVWG